MDTTTKNCSFKVPTRDGEPVPANTLLLTRSDVHAQLAGIVAGMRSVQARDDEIIVFDSSGTALQDVAAEAAVYRQALGQQQDARYSFNA